METARITPVRLDREDEKKMLPCRFFANGYCHKGNRCRFYHPLNMSLNSIIRVPPLPPNFGTNRSESPEMGRSSGSVPPPPGSPPPHIVRETRIPPLIQMNAPVQHRVVPVPNMNSYMHHMPVHQMQNDYSNYQSGHMAPAYNMMDYELPVHQHQHHHQSRVPQTHAPQASMYEPPPPVVVPHQNTLFSHIDWSEFLAPGQDPPLPTLVPDDCRERLSPGQHSEDSRTSSMLESSDEAPSVSTSNEDMPPEGRSQRKLTPKEELQMKVKQIAKELAEEPTAPIHSLDSFLRNFTYNGFIQKVPKLKLKKPAAPAASPSATNETGRACGDTCEPKEEEPGKSDAAATTTADAERFTVRDMADALIEIYIASEKEREESEERQKECETQEVCLP